MFILKTHT